MATTGVKTRYITEFTEKSDKVMELMLQILAAEDFYPQLCLQVLVVIGNFMLESRDMYKAITTKEILVNEIEYTFLPIIEDFMINSVSNYYSKDYSNENNDLNDFLETLVWLLEIILKSIPDEDCEIHKETLYKSCLATFALLFDFTKTEMINDTSQYKMLYIEDSLCKDSILELLCILIKKPFCIDPNIHPSRCSTPHEKLLQRVVFSPFESLRGYLGEMNEAPAKVYPGALAFLSDCFLYTKYLYDELFSQEEEKIKFMDEIVEIYEHSGEEKCEKLIYEIFWMMRVTIYRIQRSSLNFELIEYLCKATLACSSPKVLSCILSIFLYIIKQFVAEIKSENGNTEARDSFQRACEGIYPVLFECIPIIKVSEDNLKFTLKILELTLFPEDQLDQQAVDLYEETGLREFVQEVEDHKFQGLRDKASDLEFRIQKGQRMEEDLKCDGEALYFG